MNKASVFNEIGPITVLNFFPLLRNSRLRVQIQPPMSRRERKLKKWVSGPYLVPKHILRQKDAISNGQVFTKLLTTIILEGLRYHNRDWHFLSPHSTSGSPLKMDCKIIIWSCIILPHYTYLELGQMILNFLRLEFMNVCNQLKCLSLKVLWNLI